MTDIAPAIIRTYNEAHVEAQWRSSLDESTAKNVADVLEKKYPGYLWGVHVNVREGLIDVLNYNLTGRHGFTLKMSDLDTWDNLRDKVMRAGGELLERYNQRRAKFNADRYADLKQDFRGLPIGDTSKG